MSKKYYVFDEEGSRYEVTNIDSMLEELPNEGLEVIYKATRYFHNFNKMVLEMIEKQIIEQTEGETYDVVGVDNGLTAFEGEITTRLGEDVLTVWQEETDAQWEDNKPEPLTRPDEDSDLIV